MKKAIAILEKYQDFLEVSPTGTSKEFGSWLQGTSEEKSQIKVDQPEVDKSEINVKFAYVLSKLSSFLDVWVKLSFRDIPLRSLGDFGIIMSIRYMHNPRKTDVASQLIMEHSTCMESIKRLINDGLVEQTKDPLDRRVWRVSLTNLGHELCAILDEKMQALGDLVAGEISKSEKEQAIAPLIKLVDFHQKLYQRHDREKIVQDYTL